MTLEDRHIDIGELNHFGKIFGQCRLMRMSFGDFTNGFNHSFHEIATLGSLSNIVETGINIKWSKSRGSTEGRREKGMRKTQPKVSKVSLPRSVVHENHIRTGHFLQNRHGILHPYQINILVQKEREKKEAKTDKKPGTNVKRASFT
jgi:hypothetical protein